MFEITPVDYIIKCGFGLCCAFLQAACNKAQLVTQHKTHQEEWLPVKEIKINCEKGGREK